MTTLPQVVVGTPSLSDGSGTQYEIHNNPLQGVTSDEMQFRHEQVDSTPPSARLGACLATDLTGNGRDDIIVGGAGPHKHLRINGAPTRIPNLAGIRDSLGFPEPNLYWYENPGWERHDIANLPRIDVGHTMGDVDGDGREDLLVAQGIKNHDVYWLRQPEDPRQRWDVFLITDSYEKYHDLAFGDIDDDGKPEVVGLSQESGVIFYYDIPSDPTAEPWPENHRHIVAEGLSVEGAALADIDGDGQTELIAGPNVFHREAKDWRRQVIAEDGWDDARVAVADVDDDGVPEVILTEGDSPHLVDNPGRVAIFDPPDWSRTLLSEEMFCPHSVQVADFNGDGNPDIYVAEMGLGENEDPQHVVFENQGDGRFEPVTVADGVATHEAKVANVTGTGRPDIVGKSYGPDHHVDVLYNE